MSLKNKRVLITAGPTWVKIDSVRVISNVATGQTGVLLAEQLSRRGARVTLLLGPTGTCCLSKRIRLLRFRFFEELKNTIVQEIRARKYDIVIHTAAVSDYQSKKVYLRKLKSEIKNLELNLIPTPKIINIIKRIDSSLFLVGFKFEPAAGKDKLIKETKTLIKHANLDLAVANSIKLGQYAAYIVEKDKLAGPIFSKNILAGKLVNAIASNYGRA